MSCEWGRRTIDCSHALAEYPIVIGVGIAALALTGCGALGGSGYSDLDREREPSDELPVVSGNPDAYDDIDEESARYVGEHDGVRVWIAEGTAQNTPICLVAAADEAAWIAACGGDRTTIGNPDVG